MGAFEDETIRQKYNLVRPVITWLARTTVREVRKGESGVSPRSKKASLPWAESSLRWAQCCSLRGTHPSSGVPVCRHPCCCLCTCFVRTCTGMVVDLPAPWPPRSPQPASQGQPLQLCLSLPLASRPELPPASGSSPADGVLGLQSVCTRGMGSSRQRGEGCSGAGVPVACCRGPSLEPGTGSHVSRAGGEP